MSNAEHILTAFGLDLKISRSRGYQYGLAHKPGEEGWRLSDIYRLSKLDQVKYPYPLCGDPIKRTML